MKQFCIEFENEKEDSIFIHIFAESYNAAKEEVINLIRGLGYTEIIPNTYHNQIASYQGHKILKILV